MMIADSLRWQFDCAGVAWQALEDLFSAAALGGRKGGKIKRAFENSSVVCFGYDGTRLIAAARALTDHEYHATIYDVVVHPDLQRRGVGRRVLREILARLPVWRILLVADGEVRGFYEDAGFHSHGDMMALVDGTKLYDST